MNKERSEKSEAFICVNAEIGDEDEALKFLRSLSQVDEAEIVYGVWVIVAKVSAPTMDGLKELITKDIWGNGYVRSTLTMIIERPLGT